MRKAPSWYKPDDAVNGEWKQDLLRYLGKLFDFKILVETGTCSGSTPLALHNDFKDIYTIELADYYYQEARQRLSDFANVHLYKGNSVTVLDKLLGEIPNEPTLFWLDAHSSGGFTANEGDPLPDELRIITKMRPDSLIVIDDMKDAYLGQVTGAGVSLDGWHREFRTGEVIMHKGGYVIPPFEN